MPLPSKRFTRTSAIKPKEIEKPPPSSSSSSSSSSSEDEKEETQQGKIKNLTGFFAEQTDDVKNIKKKKFELVPSDAPEPSILENEPAERLEGIIRATDPAEWQKPIEVEKGAIKNLAHMFQKITTEQAQQKKPFKLELDENACQNSEEMVLENEPVEQLEGVVRSADPAEWQKPIDVERGATKNLAHMFQNISHSEPPISKKPFKLDVDVNAQPIILESEPVVLEGVVRSVDKTEDIIGKKGRIKNLADRFVNPNTNASDDETNDKAAKPSESNRSRTISQKWKQQVSQNDGSQERRPRSKIELDAAAEYGVYENEPEVRSDVVKASEDQPDVIFVQHTRNLRKMWCQFEKDEMAKEVNSKNIESIVKAKKKEPSPEPPPVPEVPPPVEETKPKKTWGSRNVKKEVEKTDASKTQVQPAEPTSFQKPALRSIAKKKF
ncbi:hypothetical protein HELRODRAFT_171537 [Helobdella robusta]|uniref:Uncharacterized protein n=1 Tax=Helobdella robusta TaxID=6412 RepID=T1F4E1_HELRO|nr:hypothetical protein HELRODRAFT_171537 [Helobdella robusta]ESO05196.1 hypothetical protein HELRODRAFT_171537 [Helobdella robusta]